MNKKSPVSKSGVLGLAMVLLSTGAASVNNGMYKEGGVQVAVGVALILAYEYLQAQQIEGTLMDHFLGGSGGENG